MTKHVASDNLSEDSLLGRLDSIAKRLIEVRGLLASLDSSEFAAMRTHSDALLMDVGRRIAKELGTLHAMLEAEATAEEVNA